MSGSSTENMENFGAQTMERHQIMMNNEVMKHITIMNRTSVREIMLEHEKTFKEQVHDLHKLYEVQKSLMHKAKDGEKSTFYFGVSQSTPHSMLSLPEHHANSKQKMNFWESTPTPKVVVTESLKSIKLRPFSDLENTTKGTDDSLKQQGGEGIAAKVDSKNANSSSRKKVIDLEQLPEDDTDDETDKPENVILQPRQPVSPSSCQENLKHYSSSNYGMSQISNSLAGEKNVSAKDDSYSSCVASLPSPKSSQESKFQLNSAENLHDLDGKHLAFGGTNVQPVPGVGKTTSLQNESHVDLVCGAIGNDTHWFYQGSDVSTKLLSSDFSIQKQEKLVPSHVIAGELLKDYHQQNGFHQGLQNLVMGQPGTRQLPTEATSNSVGNWIKPSAGLVGQFANSLETPKKPLLSFTSETYLPGYQFSGLVPDGESKGKHKEPERNNGYQENSVMQFQHYQPQSMFGQPFTNVNQTSWLQPSQNNTHGGLYLQGIYGAHASDASQIGLQVGGLPISQNEGKGPWNISGIGNCYPSCTQINQKFPSKKPSKIILKDEADGIDLKLVSPDGQLKEKACQRKPYDCFKKDSTQDHPNCQEKKRCIQRDEVKGKELRHEEEADIVALAASLQSNVLAAHMAPASHIQKDLISKSMKEDLSLKITKEEVNSLIVGHTSNSSSCAAQHGASREEDLAANEHNPAGLLAETNKPEFQYVKQTKMGVLREDEIEKNEQSTCHKEGNIACVTSGTLQLVNEDNQGLALSGQGSNLIPIKEDMQKGSRTVNNKSHCCSEQVKVSVASTRLEGTESVPDMAPTSKGRVEVCEGCPCNLVDNTHPNLHLKSCEGKDHVANLVEMRDVLEVKQCGESLQAKSDCIIPGALLGGSCRKDENAQAKVSQASDLSSCSQLTMHTAVSMQSTSTETPCIIKQERECPSKELESQVNDTSSLSSHKRKSIAITASDDYENLPILPFVKPMVIESKEEVVIDEWDDNLPHISDSDSLAAAILLSFAPKEKTVESSNTYREDDVNRTFSNTENGASSSRHPIVGGPKVLSLSKDIESLECRSSREKLLPQFGLKKTDIKKLDGVRFTLQERKREDHQSSPVLGHDPRSELKSNLQNNVRGKIPKVASKVSSLVDDDKAVEFPTPKQQNKLNGTGTLFPPKTSDNDMHGQQCIGQKRKDTHPPTGRRSSRGPLYHRPSQHSEDSDNGCPDELEGTHSKRREKNPNKAEAGNKSKVWNDITKKGSRPPRTQSQTLGNLLKKAER